MGHARPKRIAAQMVGVLAVGVGFELLWWSETAMSLLIAWIGYEYALGPNSVHRHADGTVFLTNPGAMIRWMIPFWSAGWSLIGVGLALIIAMIRLSRQERKAASHDTFFFEPKHPRRLRLFWIATSIILFNILLILLVLLNYDTSALILLLAGAMLAGSVGLVFVTKPSLKKTAPWHNVESRA